MPPSPVPVSFRCARWRACLVALACAGAVSGVAAQPLNRADATFVRHAAQLAQAQVEAAEVVLRKSTEAEVRRFAEQVRDDHRTAQEPLRAWAGAQGAELPPGPSPLQRARIRMLGALEATHLARRYIDEHGIAAHEEAALLYQRASREASDPWLQAYAAQRLPALRQHLDAGRRLKAHLIGAARAAAPPASARP